MVRSGRNLNAIRAAALSLTALGILAASSIKAQSTAPSVPLPPMNAKMDESLYPSSAAKQHIQGRVLMEFNITRKGKVDDATVLQSEPEGVFDNAARNALKEVKFTVPDDWEKSGNAAHRFRLSYVFKIYPCPGNPCQELQPHEAADDSMIISIQVSK